MSDATTSQCYSNFYVAKAANQTYLYDPNSFDFKQPFNGGNAFVRFSRKGIERTITKPLIIVEGYDISHVAPDIVTNYGYNNFVDDISDPTNPFDFNSHLDDLAGYDLIFVDYNDGTDDITSNAALLEDVITWVNAQKAANGSIEQNVVMGISMGGLVARYALADMTKKSLTTGTRLLITHDSPHRGANVPLGLQYLIEMAGGLHLFSYNIRDVYPQYDETINLLARPATQQLLLYRATGATTSANNTFLDADYRNMITFSPNGPQPTYSFVATSLGSECAHPLFPAYQQLINSDADAFGFFFPLLSYHFRTTIKAYAMPNTGYTNLIASLLLKSKFKLFGLITISKQVYNNSAYAPGTQLPVDGAPGGKYTLTDGTIPRVQAFFPFVFANIFGYASVNSGTLPKEFCFVPAGSALDVSPFNTATFAQKFVAGNNPNYLSTSSNYIAQNTISTGVYNNDHPRFTARNAEWMFDQMENISNTLNCSTECNPDLVISVSANPICSSSTVSIPGLSLASTVTWSASPSGSVTITPNGQQATITKGSYNGTVTITAIVNSCNSYSTTIPVGTPSPTTGTYNSPTNSNESMVPFYRFDLTTSNPSCIAFITNISAPGSTSVQWLGPNDPDIYWLQSGDNIFCNFSAVGQIAVFTVSSSNACGTTYTNYRFKCTTTSSCGITPLIVIIAPNPAKSTMNVSLAQNNTSRVKQSFQKIKIIDKMGNIKQNNQYPAGTKSTSVNISLLAPDIYTIQIFDGHSWYSEKFIKN